MGGTARQPSWIPTVCVTLLLCIPAISLLICLVAEVAFGRVALITLSGILAALLVGSPVVGLVLIALLKRRDRHADVFWPGFLLFLTGSLLALTAMAASLLDF